MGSEVMDQQKLINERVRLQIGGQALDLIALGAENDMLRAEVERLSKSVPGSSSHPAIKLHKTESGTWVVADHGGWIEGEFDTPHAALEAALGAQ